VIDSAGAPQGGAKVSLFRVDHDTRLSSVAKRDQTADAAGIVRFDQLETGVEYKLSATTSDHLLGFLECAPTSGKPRVEIGLRVSRPIGAKIHIHDDAGKPIRNAFIFGLWGTGPNGMIRFETKDLPTFGLSSQRSDAEGKLPLPEIPDGLTGFHLLHPDYVPVVFEEKPIEQGSTIDITMHDGVKVELDVNVQGGPLPKDGVQLFLDHESIHSPSTLIGVLPDLPADGKIRLTLAPGKCSSVYVKHPDYISTPEYYLPFKQFDLRGSGNRFAFQFRRNLKLKGKVVEEETGKPAKGINVKGLINAGKVEGPFADFATQWNELQYATTDERGEYEIELPPGKVRINANVGKVIARPEFVELEIAADGTAKIPDIHVSPIPNVSGVVLDPAGKPVPKAIVRFRDSDRLWDGPVFADSQGRFELSPEGNSTDLMTDKVKPAQTILAFHPYEPLGGEATISFADSKSCANVELRLKAQSYDFPVEAFPTENEWYLQQLSSERRAERAAMTRPGQASPELDGAVWLNTNKPKTSLADFRGRSVLLDFWTTWCGPCAHDRPRLDAAYELYKDKGLAVICVHDNSVPVDEVKKYVAEHHIHYPVVIDHEDGRILKAYKSLGVEGYPTYLLIGPDGRTMGDPTHTGRGLYHFKFEILRQQLMSQPAGVGAALRVENKKVMVTSVLPDSAAARSDALHPDDQIVAITEENGEPVDVAGLALEKVVALVRGRNGTVVRLTMIPAGKEASEARVVSLTRGPVNTPFGGLGDGKPLTPGIRAPNVKFTRLDNETVDELDHHHGKMVVLIAWASWCKPCLEHLTKLDALAAEHSEWNGRVEILPVSVDERREDATASAKAQHWKTLSPAWAGPAICDAYHINGVPTTYVIDRDGTIIAADNRLNIAELIEKQHLLDDHKK
jgi:thiol-disulfide isomerase/thioredoxin/protocatechuate 3,4-dioxygenase beta subunit